MSSNLEIAGPVTLVSDLGPEMVWYVSDGDKLGIVVRATEEVPDLVLVRVQSSCVFSESLGAIDCDCNRQLQHARALILAEGGLLLYVFEEGRGAGLAAKFQSIMTQQRDGVGTGQAFDMLGIPRDPRTYAFARSVISTFVPNAQIKILTNNPTRKQALLDAGLPVVESVPILLPSPETTSYLADKAESLGHEVRYQ